jgi:hypothetical protein
MHYALHKHKTVHFARRNVVHNALYETQGGDWVGIGSGSGRGRARAGVGAGVWVWVGLGMDWVRSKRAPAWVLGGFWSGRQVEELLQ